MVDLTPHALLFTLAAVGISVTAYLVRERRAMRAPVCPIGNDCGTVLSSSYNTILLGVPNDVAGLLFYVVLAVATALLVLDVSFTDTVFQITTVLLAFASAFSLFLTYLQWRVVRAWCFWCLMSAGIIGLMDVIILTAHLT